MTTSWHSQSELMPGTQEVVVSLAALYFLEFEKSL